MNHLKPDAWFPWWPALPDKWGPLRVEDTVNGVICVLGSLLVYWVLRRLVLRAIHGIAVPLARRVEGEGSGAAAARAVTLRGVLTSIANYLLLFILGVMILHSVGLNPTALLTGAGVMGLAVGFGAQKLVRDVITGFFILLEDQFSVGDTITAAGVTGVVQEIGMRLTRLRDEVGKQITLSNGDITTVTNHSRGPTVVAVDVSVAAATDLEAVRACVDRAAATLAEHDALLREPPAIRGVTAFDATRVTLRITARAVPGRQMDGELALRAAVREELLRAEIALV